MIYFIIGWIFCMIFSIYILAKEPGLPPSEEIYIIITLVAPIFLFMQLSVLFGTTLYNKLRR